MATLHIGAFGWASVVVFSNCTMRKQVLQSNISHRAVQRLQATHANFKNIED